MSEAMVVASNRGPVSWQRDDSGTLVPSRGFGGLVTALGGALQQEPGTWVSVALSADDREIADEHVGEAFDVEASDSTYQLRLIDAGAHYEPYYNEISNRLLWFTVHQLWGEPYEPAGIGWREAWADYEAVNAMVADEVVAADGDEIYLQDYHLATAAERVGKAQPQAAILQYIHTPWCPPEYLGRLPDEIARGVMEGLLAADVVGFSSHAWCEAFLRCAEAVVGAGIDGRSARHDGHTTAVLPFTLGVDAEDLASSAASEEVQRAGAELDAEADGRALILRVDRTDLSKNILRGLVAFEALLEHHPEHRDSVWHYAHLNPSRQGVAEYRDYLERCQAVVDRIHERFGQGCLTFFVGDNHPRAIAAQQRSDVLLTNPVTDGTNLVAKEGPVLNQRDGVLVLSRTAGAADVLGEAALLVNPYDVEEQAEALHRALTMDAGERANRAATLSERAKEGDPVAWFAAQREALRDVQAANR